MSSLDDTSLIREFQEGDHGFLGPALFIPNLDKTDGIRGAMATNGIQQMLVLCEPELPIVNTSFEDQFMEWSRLITRAPEEMVLRKIFKKSENVIDYLFETTNEHRLIVKKYRHAVNLTEKYGFTQINAIQGIEVGDTVPKGTILWHSNVVKGDPHEDPYKTGSYAYGTNLRVAYLPFDGLTFEDAMVVWDEAAKTKLAHEYVSIVDVIVNTNDVFIRQTDENENYKIYPLINDSIVDGILCTTRKINYDNLSAINDKHLTQINYNTDVNYYVTGKVVDIEIFCNMEDESALSDYPYMKQILEAFEKQKEYTDEIRKVYGYLKTKFDKSVDTEIKYDLAKLALTESGVKWKTSDGNVFDTLMLRFTVKKRVGAFIGTKVTGRYGNKGVVSKILPAEQMPKTEDGKPLDACLNPLAIFNRLIPSASVEHELDHICVRMVQYIDSHQVISFPDRDGDILTIDLTDYCHQAKMTIERAKIYAFTELFLRQTSVKQYTQWTNMLLNANNDEICELWNEMVTDRVYILQEPFHDNVSKENLWYLYDILEYLYPERSHLYKLDCSNEPLIVARSYFIKLKHEPLSKFSARSLGSVNAKMIPSKNGMQYKSYKSLYNTLPVRFGEQEFTNAAMFANTPDQLKELNRWINMVSANAEYRGKMCTDLLSYPSLPVNIPEFSDVESNSTTLHILRALMDPLGLKLVKS